MHDRAIIHACLVAIDGAGVLIIGDSGVGKTTVCLELSTRGHDFIADDAVEIKRSGDGIIGSPATAAAGLVAIRGVGSISRIPKGLRSTAIIDLIAELISNDETTTEITIDAILKTIPRKRLKVTDSTAKSIEMFVRDITPA